MIYAIVKDLVVKLISTLEIVMVIRKSDSEEVGLEDDNQAVLDDVGYNADLYFANQEVVYDFNLLIFLTAGLCVIDAYR